MRIEIQQLFMERPELKKFARHNPIWYRKLTRDPSQMMNLEKEANYFYGRTFPQRVEKVQNNLNLVMMLMEMIQMGQTTYEQTQGPAS